MNEFLVNNRSLWNGWTRLAGWPATPPHRFSLRAVREPEKENDEP